MKTKKQLQDKTISNVIAMLEAIAENYVPEDTFTNHDISSNHRLATSVNISSSISNEQLKNLYAQSNSYWLDAMSNAPFADRQKFRNEYPVIRWVKSYIIQQNSVAATVITMFNEERTLTIPLEFFAKARYPKSYNPSYLKSFIDLSDVFNVTEEPFIKDVTIEDYFYEYNGKTVRADDIPRKVNLNSLPREWKEVTIPVECKRFIYTYNPDALQQAINELKSVLAKRQEKREAINQAAQQTIDYIKSIGADTKDIIKAIEKLSKAK